MCQVRQNPEIKTFLSQNESVGESPSLDLECIAKHRRFLGSPLELLLNYIRTSEKGLVVPSITFRVYSEDCRRRGGLVSLGLLMEAKRKALVSLEAPPCTCEQQLVQAFEELLPK